MNNVLIISGSRDLWPLEKHSPDYVSRGLDWDVQGFVNRVLDQYQESYLKLHLLVHGACRGADTLAHEWATLKGIEVEQFPAQWELLGKAAGMIRNREMLKAYPQGRLIAFPGPASVGTWGCMKDAVKRNMAVDCYEFTVHGPMPSVRNWKSR